MAPGVGFEPTTDRLTADCSTTELPGIDAQNRGFTISRDTAKISYHAWVFRLTLAK